MTHRQEQQTTFETDSVDIASYLITLGHEATIAPQHGSRRAVFKFTATNELYKAISEFTIGFPVPANRLLNTRNWLFRRASEIGRGEVRP